MAVQHDEAVCIRLWDWSETSQTAALFTRSSGVVRCLAKGSRRPKAPYSGGLELLTRGEAGLVIKPASELALLTEWDLRETFPHLRQNLRCYYASMYVADLAYAMIIDRQEHEALYTALVDALRSLHQEQAVWEVLARFQWAALVQCGYHPVLDRYVNTDGPLGEEAVLAFHADLGGLIDAAAPLPAAAAPASGPRGRPVARSGAGGAWLIRASTLAVLRQIAQSEHEPDADKAAQREVDMHRAASFLGAYARYLLDSHLSTMTMVFPELARWPKGQSEGRVR